MDTYATVRWLRAEPEGPWLDSHPSTPALSFITALRNDAAAILLALQSALDKLGPNDKAAIGIKDILQIPAGEYLAVENPCSKP
ncbi:hypothetical protein KO498_02685 [Lentibacter algarum]|uniref:hypothetical protein n=1 Tax=Lentibacter algarum TaxID=576131 RepID=UPI001C079666|nr:hypothetical protein [Lentibacter algarum]MBU2980711.1 hypothetical protein [Lentibacter algarum]